MSVPVINSRIAARSFLSAFRNASKFPCAKRIVRVNLAKSIPVNSSTFLEVSDNLLDRISPVISFDSSCFAG